MPNREKSQAVFDRAMNVLSKGVSSNFRYWGPDSTPVVSGEKVPKCGTPMTMNISITGWDGVP
jgi:hypothetical protein